MGWVLRLAETGPDAAGSIDLIEIHRSTGLADIANLGLTLSEAKELLARVQQAIVAARVRDHAVRTLYWLRVFWLCRSGENVKDQSRTVDRRVYVMTLAENQHSYHSEGVRNHR